MFWCCTRCMLLVHDMSSGFDDQSLFLVQLSGNNLVDAYHLKCCVIVSNNNK